MISSDDILEAEQTLIRSRSIQGVPGSPVLYDRARIISTAGDNFVRNMERDLRRRLPDLDPRFEPILNTLFRHALCVGAVAGREDQRRDT